MFSLRMSMRYAGRAKFTHGERHMPEHRAWVILARLDAFLVRNAVLGCLNQILGRTNDANNRENAEGYRQVTPSFPVCQRTAQAIANGFGNIAAATAAVTISFPFTNAGTENNGINDLCYRDVIGK
jgi:hypothetical protein